MSTTDILDFIPTLVIILTVTLLLLSGVIIFVIWRIRVLIKKNREHRIELAIYKLKEFPEVVTYDDVYQEYLDIKNFEKIEKYIEFSNLSKEILCCNIKEQETFKDLDKFFANWKTYSKNKFMMEIHSFVTQKTKERVIALAKKYNQKLMQKGIHDYVTAERFNREINKEYFVIGFKLPDELKHPVDGIITLRDQQKSHEDK